MNKLEGELIHLPGGGVAWWPCHISSSNIGIGTNIGALAHIGKNVTIGKDCKIQGGAYIADSCIIGDRLFMGPNATITNDRYPPSNGKWSPVIIGSDVVLGAGCTIVAGVTIGDNSMIGAGSVVTKDVEKGTVVAGVPAKLLMSKEEYENRRD